MWLPHAAHGFDVTIFCECCTCSSIGHPVVPVTLVFGPCKVHRGSPLRTELGTPVRELCVNIGAEECRVE